MQTASALYLALAAITQSPQLGLTVEPYTDNPAKRPPEFNNVLTRPKSGVKVLKVTPGSLADTWIRTDAVITEVNGVAVKSQEDLDAEVKKAGMGKVTLRGFQRTLEKRTKAELIDEIYSLAPPPPPDPLAEMKSHFDKFTETTFWDHRLQPSVGKTGVNLSAWQTKDGTVRRWLRLSYAGKEWAFIDGGTFLIDDKRYTVKAKRDDIARDNDGRGVWEWFHVSGDGENAPLIEALSKCEAASLRLNGDWPKDYELTKDELLRIRDVVKAAEALRKPLKREGEP